MTSSYDTSKIEASHLRRKAVIYLRQSSPGQVKRNTGSTQMQYALAQRAKGLGWHAVEVVDEDLGMSATLGAAARPGFDRVIAMVARSQVGVVFGLDVSRLLRTDSDWCQLAEVCQVFDTLLADNEGLYDLNRMDDHLVAGIKGTLSVVEFKRLRLRLQGGREEKARRGTLVHLLPPGYVYDADFGVAKDPDRRVQEALSLVFQVFRETWSVRQTFKWFHDEGIELPVNQVRAGKWGVCWKLPSHSFVDEVLRNPWYAGAFVWGRRPVRMELVGGRLVRRHGKRREAEDCRVFLREHHEGYISWEQYEEHRRMRRRNAPNMEQDPAVAVARAGSGLLAGLLRCGRCGRRMRVRYWGKAGTAARYLCVGDYPAGGEYCQAFGGATVDRRFAEVLLEALSPLGIEASLQALEQLEQGGDKHRSALSNQLEQLRYEARRAFEQYDEVDPRNRLVAAELERRWNSKLQELAELEAELTRQDSQTHTLSAEDREAVLTLGQHFEAVWHSVDCPNTLKKKITHTVIDEIVVELDDQTQRLHFIIHWRGGSHTRYEMDKPSAGRGRKTSEEDLAIIRKLAVRYGDNDIARVLSRMGRRTATGRRWNQTRVKSARKSASIPGQARTIPDPEILTLNGAAKHTGTSDTTITRLVNRGLLPNHQDVPWAPWEIYRADLDSEPVRSILAHLRATGKLVFEGFGQAEQQELF